LYKTKCTTLPSFPVRRDFAVLSKYDYKVGYSDELERIPHEGGVSRVGHLVLYKCALLDDRPVTPKTCRSLHIKTLL